MESPSPGHEPVIYVSSEKNAASGGIIFKAAQREFPNVRLGLRPNLGPSTLIAAALRYVDRTSGNVVEAPAPKQMNRYLSDRLEQRLNRLRTAN